MEYVIIPIGYAKTPLGYVITPIGYVITPVRYIINRCHLNLPTLTLKCNTGNRNSLIIISIILMIIIITTLLIFISQSIPAYEMCHLRYADSKQL